MADASSSPRVVFILALSSDIGTELALHYAAQGDIVCGTYRHALPARLASVPGLAAVQCDISEPESARQIGAFFRERELRWDVFISCVGQLAPVGPFFSTDFEGWAEAVQVNSTGQLRALHAIHRYRRPTGKNHAVFFAGGGTNNPFPSYSAYCIGKIALIKMCELLDDECPELNAFIVGTGWVRTKIHDQTLAAGADAGLNFSRTERFVLEGVAGTPHADIAAMIDWGIAQGRAVVGGRNFSVVHDAWSQGGEKLAAALRADPHLFKLRRHGNALPRAGSSVPVAA